MISSSSVVLLLVLVACSAAKPEPRRSAHSDVTELHSAGRVCGRKLADLMRRCAPFIKECPYQVKMLAIYDRMCNNEPAYGDIMDVCCINDVDVMIDLLASRKRSVVRQQPKWSSV